MGYFEKKIENKMSVNEDLRLKLLSPPKDQIRVVMDTDTFNEIDDQFKNIFKTTVLCTKYASRHMKSDGVIINIGSVTSSFKYLISYNYIVLLLAHNYPVVFHKFWQK